MRKSRLIRVRVRLPQVGNSGDCSGPRRSYEREDLAMRRWPAGINKAAVNSRLLLPGAWAPRRSLRWPDGFRPDRIFTE